MILVPVVGANTGAYWQVTWSTPCMLECLINGCNLFTCIIGSPSISGINFDSGSRTLTCSSSGGPATTVTWRRNCLILQNSSDFVQNQVVTSTALADYENTLTFNGAIIDGVYTCSVKNSRGYSSSITGIGSKFMNCYQSVT